MPTLLLPPRYTPDTNAIWQAAVAAGWETERVHGWRVRGDPQDGFSAAHAAPTAVQSLAEAFLGLRERGLPTERFDGLARS